MITINQVKNTKEENIKFTPNTLIMLKKRERETTNGIEVTVNYLEICQLKDTKDLTLISGLLQACLGEYNTIKDFEKSHKDTNIRQSQIVKPYLNTNRIFKTDSNGKISQALISEINFNKTALNIKQGHTLVNCEPKNLKSAFYNHSKAVFAQCCYLSTVNKSISDIIALCEDENAVKQLVRASKSKPKTDEKAA